ncbi:hypothetical protein LVD17_26895 [Fulvivirga ulvae]|uniref:hypothetical protein n=1 Tax=Fulvivirga ulvae TaxID=2904245 RepID=UPI001F2A5A3B|nr:hypothetical protein [Fulvivirga ulvae]UII31920.1 hypothetical protein LVD17_26895 [Fulvivirga ulvae]
MVKLNCSGALAVVISPDRGYYTLSGLRMALLFKQSLPLGGSLVGGCLGTATGSGGTTGTRVCLKKDYPSENYR